MFGTWQIRRFTPSLRATSRRFTSAVPNLPHQPTNIRTTTRRVRIIEDAERFTLSMQLDVWNSWGLANMHGSRVSLW